VALERRRNAERMTIKQKEGAGALEEGGSVSARVRVTTTTEAGYATQAAQ
jgi:hypothetical protein